MNIRVKTDIQHIFIILFVNSGTAVNETITKTVFSISNQLTAGSIAK